MKLKSNKSICFKGDIKFELMFPILFLSLNSYVLLESDFDISFLLLGYIPGIFCIFIYINYSINSFCVENEGVFVKYFFGVTKKYFKRDDIELIKLDYKRNKMWSHPRIIITLKNGKSKKYHSVYLNSNDLNLFAKNLKSRLYNILITE